jgi:hypothetical protein
MGFCGLMYMKYIYMKKIISTILIFIAVLLVNSISTIKLDENTTNKKTETIEISTQSDLAFNKLQEPKSYAVQATSLQPTIVNIVVQPGWGVSHVAKAAGLNYLSESTWNNIANTNGYGNWRVFALHPGMNVKVSKAAQFSTPAPKPQQPAQQPQVLQPQAATIQYNQEYIKKRICETFPGDCNRALVIAQHESSFNPSAVSPPNYDGSRDYGLFQINCRWHGYKVGGNCHSFLDLETNLRIAKQIYSQEGGWSRWSTSKFL